jgi:hypothetical protein
MKKNNNLIETPYDTIIIMSWVLVIIIIIIIINIYE